MKGIVSVLFLLIFSTLVFGQQVTAYWSLTWNGNCSNTVGPVSGTPIIRSHAVPVPTISYSSSKGVSSNTWDTTTFDETNYYQYKLTANANIILNYCQVNLETNCPYLHCAIRYSLDNFATNSIILADYNSGNTNQNTYVNNFLSIPMNSGQTVTVRIYGWGALYASNVFYNQNFYLCGQQSDTTLPVELSSFTAALTTDSNISLNWVTQSETNVLGYSVYRNTENLVSSANCLTQGLIPATNTSFTHTYSFTDHEVGNQHLTYYYWLQYTEFSGQTVLNGPVTIEVNNNNGTPGSVPNYTSIQSVYPNPFQGSSRVKYGLTKADKVTLDIYNIKGQHITNLMAGVKDAGTYDLVWNGKDMKGDNCAAGIYYIIMNTASTHTVRKLVKL
jgi:hypothetical protein